MEVLKTIGKIDSDGHLRLDLMTNLPEGKIDLLLVIDSASKDAKETKYDFSDLVGKLSWKGNAVVVQRELRNEW
jgi:hypothetical protein